MLQLNFVYIVIISIPWVITGVQPNYLRMTTRTTTQSTTILPPSPSPITKSSPKTEVDSPDLKYVGLKFLYPNQLLESWKRTSLIDLKCPPRIIGMEHLKDGDEDFMSVLRVEEKGEKTKGFMCAKHIYRTTCTETWYFSSTVDKRIIPSQIAEIECTEAISKFKTGQIDLSYFPEPKCIWNDNNDSDNKGVSVHEVELDFNPYATTVMSNILLDGSCGVKDDERFCKGVSDNVLIWIDGFNVSGLCNLKTVRGYIYKYREIYHPAKFNHYVVYNPSLKPFHILNACTTMYCNKNFVVLKSGDAFAPGSKMEMLIDSSRLEKCPPEREVKIPSLEEVADSIILNEDELINAVMCQNFVDRLKDVKEIRQSDLIHFFPTSPGRNAVYYLNDTGLFKSSANYERCQVVGPAPDFPLMCSFDPKDSVSNSVIQKYWNKNMPNHTVGDFMVFPMGFKKKGNKTINPVANTLLGQIFLLEEKKYPVNLVHHPVVSHVIHQLKLSGVEVQHHGKNGSIIDSVSYAWHSFTDGIGKWVTIFLCVIVTLAVLYCLAHTNIWKICTRKNNADAIPVRYSAKTQRVNIPIRRR
uniref:Glycoprotein n=1 Tax=Murine feces-associated rhabdovirus TaxID=2171387 RepID=A0A2S0SYX1_9RHAB|nr:glycoprotein [Murine feces-associated rhabdovirus]